MNNNEFYKQNSDYPPYFQFPWFILGLDLSMTAKTIYALMTYRAKGSAKNKWIDADGYVYIIYSYSELAEKLHISEKTVQRGIRELKESGYIRCKKRGLGKPNWIYVTYPKKLKTIIENATWTKASEGTESSDPEGTNLSGSDQPIMSHIVKNTRVNHKKNAFHNFDQRTYDYDKLEELLFNRQRNVPKS